MAQARLVAAGTTLRTQVNKRFPKRDTASDGWIGDAAHAARESDHNVDPKGWVHALDLDEDFGTRNDNMIFANQLIACARNGDDGGRLKYVVYEDQIASGTYRTQIIDGKETDVYWRWRGSGYDHKIHIHTSFTAKAEKDGKEFPLPILGVRGTMWDGVVPDLDNVRKSMDDPKVRNIAAWRVACKLRDAGHYTGTPPVQSVQGYPELAVVAFQKMMGWEGSGRYGDKTHQALFGR